MSDSEKIRTRSTRWKSYAWVLAVVWTVVVGASLVWNVVQVRHNTKETMRHHARASFEKDLIWRRWVVGRSGVYVPVSEETPPNPYLSHIEERDITTPSGHRLTLFNPAYVTRQVHELGDNQYGIRGHITSLNPIRPENAPDPWETKALQAFERGETEMSSVEDMEGEEYMRLMRPLVTEEGCLKCHSAQGYKAGDIRGGISISIPMELILAIAQRYTIGLALGHGLLWILGLSGIGLGAQRLTRSERGRKRAEEELKENAVQLEQANIHLQEADRLKTVFFASMSHELRTPLNSIIGFTGIILQGLAGPLSDEQTKQLGMICDSARHLLNLINDILDVSRIEAGQLETTSEMFDMRETIEKVVEIMTPLAEKKDLVLVAEVAPEVGQITSDRQRVEQILVNLVNNSVKFTEKGEVRIECQISNGLLVTHVVDTGIGIKPEDVGMLFEAFCQTDNRHEGTGLGLFICKKLVEMLGGELRVQSEWGVGSTFTFTLPTHKT